MRAHGHVLSQLHTDIVQHYLSKEDTSLSPVETIGPICGCPKVVQNRQMSPLKHTGMSFNCYSISLII